MIMSYGMPGWRGAVLYAFDSACWAVSGGAQHLNPMRDGEEVLRLIDGRLRPPALGRNASTDCEVLTAPQSRSGCLIDSGSMTRFRADGG